MDQPKFSVGDKIMGLLVAPFEIEKIEINNNGVYYYNNDNSRCVAEMNAKLYQEPKKRNLYAWSSRDGVVFHISSLNCGPEAFHRIGIDAQGFKRAPEFDIEYPEK